MHLTRRAGRLAAPARVRGTSGRPAPLFACLATLLPVACASAPERSAACALPYTSVGLIQGRGNASPMAGQEVTTQGVVVGDFEGPAPALRGFYIQDIRGDGDPSTSDGIFVFNGDRDDVAPGEVVRVTGVAAEVQQQTQVAAASVVACGTGSVQPVDVTLPFTSAASLERYEGMLVRLPQTLYVTEHYQLGRFVEVVLSSGGRLPQPTSVADPGSAARAIQAANDLNRIIIDDGSYEQNPATIVFARGRAPLGADNTLRGGDHVTGITGVLTQTTASGADGGSAYRLRPVNALNGGVPDFVAASPRDARPPDVGGTLRVASFNVLNYFNTFDGCTLGTGGAATSCRGADDAVEFDRQWRKIVAAVIAMDTDILGIIEIENDGYHARSAIADLVSRLNSATAAGRYMFINSDSATGDANVLGTDAIKVGLIYRRDRVSPAGRTAVLNSSMFVNGGESQPRNRPSLAQAFVQPDGGSVIVSVHHFKSKGSACDAPDAGDGQGNCNTARTVAARELLTWLDTDPTGTGDPNVLIIGDLNAYAREDPVAVLVRGGYTDLLAGRAAESPAEPASSDVPIGERSGTAGYSFVFNGQWGYLDHALASTALLPQVTGAVAWHINADEPNVLDYNTNFKTAAQLSTLYDDGPFRSSDHDPVIVGLRLATRGDTR